MRVVRFTRAEAIVRQIGTGVLDFIGSARPSIVGPFLPVKALEDRFEDIRKCIGCYLCVSDDMTGGINRCSQSTPFMEEWHPWLAPGTGAAERHVADSAGGGRGASGFGSDLAAGQAGGGRVTQERALPGLSA